MDDPLWWKLLGGEFVALIGALLTAAVAIVAILAQGKTARDAAANAKAIANDERAHALRCAREDREQARLKDLYDEVVTTIVRAEWTIDRTAPVLTPSRPPPKDIDEEKLIELNARTAIHGTDGMHDALMEFREAQSEFFGKVWEREFYRKDEDLDPEAKRKSFQLWGELDKIRTDRVKPAARAVETAARKDLHPSE